MTPQRAFLTNQVPARPPTFLVVILGRQQLFTENTPTPMLPLLQRKDLQTLLNLLRLWGVVFAANMLGALAVAWVRTGAFDPEIRHQFLALGHQAITHPFGQVVFRAVFAGWLIANLTTTPPRRRAPRPPPSPPASAAPAFSSPASSPSPSFSPSSS